MLETASVSFHNRPVSAHFDTKIDLPFSQKFKFDAL